MADIITTNLDAGTDSPAAARPQILEAIQRVNRLSRAVVSVLDFGATGNGTTDDTTAIQTALASGATDIYMPAGTYLFTAQLSIPNYVTLRGAGYSLFAGSGGTRLLKRGSFNGVVLNLASQLLDLSLEGDTGNGLDGVMVLGGRSLVSGVSSLGHGRDGFKIGDYTASAANTNLWRLTNCVSRSNSRYGYFIAHEGSGAAPNCNAGIALGLDALSNGSDGLRISESYDNQILGLCAQLNGGYGWRIGVQGKGNMIPQAYTETNTSGDGILDSGADRNYILGFRGGALNDGWVNNGAENILIGRQGSVSAVPLHRTVEAYLALRMLETTTSGVWDFSKEATTRNLLFTLSGTSASADVLIQSTGGGAAGLRFATAAPNVALRGMIFGSSTLNFGSVPANSSTDVTVTISGGDATYAYIASPRFAVPTGITISVYWDGTAIKARAANSTTAAVTVSGAVAVHGFKLV